MVIVTVVYCQISNLMEHKLLNRDSEHPFNQDKLYDACVLSNILLTIMAGGGLGHLMERP